MVVKSVYKVFHGRHLNFDQNVKFMFALSEMNDFWLYLVWGNVDGDMSRAAAATNAEQLILLQLSYKVWEQQ